MAKSNTLVGWGPDLGTPTTVVLLRLSPLVPFNLLNFARGASCVAPRAFLVGALGMIPGTLLYVGIGRAAADVSSAAFGARTRSTAEWVLLGVGVLATLAVTILLARTSSRRLDRRAARSDQAPSSAASASARTNASPSTRRT